MAERPVIFTCIVGQPGCGKTSLMLSRFIPALGQKKTLIIDPDGQEEKWQRFPRIDVGDDAAVRNLKGTAWSYCLEDHELMFKKINDNFRDGLLLLDDCRTYSSANAERSFRFLMRRKRQLMIDVVVAAHGFTEVPPSFLSFATDYVLFSTLDNIEMRKKELYPFEAFRRRKLRVDQTAAQTGNLHHFEYFSKMDAMKEIAITP